MSTTTMSERRLKIWQAKSAIPIICLSFVYIVSYVVPIFFYPMRSSVTTALSVLEYTVWGVFLVDYLVQMQLADDKKYFFRHEWLSLVFVACPFLRPIRAVRGVLFIREASTKRNSLVSSLPAIFGALGVLLVIITAAAVLSAERLISGANITTPSDALYWSVSTMTGSSAGGLSPITNEGRAIAAGLRIFGIGLLASTTGYVATWVLSQFNIVRRETGGDDAQSVPGLDVVAVAPVLE
jgi:voltage-gated potassium channel